MKIVYLGKSCHNYKNLEMLSQKLSNFFFKKRKNIKLHTDNKAKIVNKGNKSQFGNEEFQAVYQYREGEMWKAVYKTLNTSHTHVLKENTLRNYT